MLLFQNSLGISMEFEILLRWFCTHLNVMYIHTHMLCHFSIADKNLGVFKLLFLTLVAQKQRDA